MRAYLDRAQVLLLRRFPVLHSIIRAIKLLDAHLPIAVPSNNTPPRGQETRLIMTHIYVSK